MGLGRYANGLFRLVLSVRHNADAARLEEWRRSFQHASQMLFDATDGQHRFSEVLVANNSRGGAEGDCWLMEDEGASSSSHRFGRAGFFCQLWADERFKPFIVLHEFSHYAYDVFDEYEAVGGADAECIGGSTSNACIMESSWRDGDRFGNNADGGPLVRGRVREYCHAGNHDPDGDTRQHTRRGHSCWESMVARPFDLVMPAGAPSSTSPGIVPNLNWVVLADEQRVMFVVDRSASMRGRKLEEAQVGAHWWVDDTALGDRLGLASYATSASVDHHLTTVAAEADRQSYHDAIDTWSASGNTSLGGGLRSALDEILGTGPRAAAQIAVLLSDGLHNRGEHPDDVLPDLIDSGVRVYTLGVGSTIDEELLGRIASETGGGLTRIDPSLSQADQEFAIRTELQRISTEARDNGGVVTSSEHSLERGSSRKYKAHVEKGCKHVTFLVSRRVFKDELEITLVDPSGRVINAATNAGDVRVIQGDQPYTAFKITSPTAGIWQVNVAAARANARPAGYHFFVFAENPLLACVFSPDKPIYKPNEVVRLELSAFAPLPVTGLTVKATTDHNGQALRFNDAGKTFDEVAGDGVYTASLNAPLKPGVYGVTAVVVGSKDITMATVEAERTDAAERRRFRRTHSIQTGEFTRVLKTSFVVTK